MSLTLEDLKDLYDCQIDYAKRMLTSDKFTKEAKATWQSYVHGVYSTVDKLMQYNLDLNKIPKMQILSADEADKIGADYQIQLFNNTYYIKIDDYGQCFTLLLDDKEYGLGTYNTTPEPEILYLVFQHIHDTNLEFFK